MKVIKKNYKLLIGFILGLLVAGTSVYATTVISSKDISYDNTTSKLSSTNVKDALDELQTKISSKYSNNIIGGYTYDKTSCVTGNEPTCVETTCYKSTTANSCKAGDIIKYKVNDTDVVTFHVMFDNGNTLTMQSQTNTIYNTAWISNLDYKSYNTDSTKCSDTACTDEGPMTILSKLEEVTSDWSNVNNQTYTMGTTVFNANAFTNCTNTGSCKTNLYTLDTRTAKARMITYQEASALGCTTTQQSCPIWLYNYLYESNEKSGTIADATNINDSVTYAYWTMTSSSSVYAWTIYGKGLFFDNSPYTSGNGARAVVVVNK